MVRQTIKEKTGGTIKAKLYPANALGDYTVVQERVALGAVDMACQTPSSAADKRFQLPYFPYMFKNFAQAEKNYRVGAPFVKSLKLFIRNRASSSWRPGRYISAESP